MSLPALLVSAILEIAAPDPAQLACSFPGRGPAETTISLRVEALPLQVTDRPLFRVRMHLPRLGAFKGLAQPIDMTEERDVMIRAEASDQTFYTIGLRDDGRAALNLLRVADGPEPIRHETRPGTCRDHRRLIDTWLTS